MKVLKGFALGILGFLLFLSLSSFGTIYALDKTMLNADFMASEFNKLDITSLIKDEVHQRVPPELKAITPTLDRVIADAEPWIKEQASLAIHAGYDYIQGRSQSLNIVFDLEPLKEQMKPPNSTS